MRGQHHVLCRQSRICTGQARDDIETFRALHLRGLRKRRGTGQIKRLQSTLAHHREYLIGAVC